MNCKYCHMAVTGKDYEDSIRYRNFLRRYIDPTFKGVFRHKVCLNIHIRRATNER